MLTMSEIKHIIVGVDGSDSSKGALAWAYDEAVQHGAAYDGRRGVPLTDTADEPPVRVPAA